MTTSSPSYQHPYGSLEAYALNALDPQEEEAVADHLERCDSCAALVEQDLRVALAITDSIPSVELPDSLRTFSLDVTDSQSPSVPLVSVTRPRPPRSWARVSPAVVVRWGKRLSPALALVAVAAIAVSAVLNLQFAGQMGDMKSENSQLQQQLDESMATTDALARSSEAVSQMQGNLQRWQQTSYALAQPGNNTLVLAPARPGIDSRGILVMSEDGHEAILMASDLDLPQPDEVYHVWLTRGGQWYWAGEMDVDERGWGTMPLNTADSLYEYDSVQLSRGVGVAAARAAPVGSAQQAQNTASMLGDMVLVASLR